MPDIFLSYNREDQARAKLFAEALIAQGFDVWWDVGLRTGEAYDQVTEKALKEARAVVVLWSKKSVDSRWVRAEATLADRNKTLLPVMIEACDRPIMFELTQTAELSHWQGDAGNQAWIAFLSDVKRFVAKEAAPRAEAPALPIAAPSVRETLKPGQSGSAPSLAVLPFTNRSGLPEDEVFAIGMGEDVAAALSLGRGLKVISQSVTFAYRKNTSDLHTIGQELGAGYFLEGNVRRVGQTLRVTAQLVEADNGAILWTQKFDRALSEVAELQEELVEELAANLGVQIHKVEMARAKKKRGDVTAWEAVARAASTYRTWDTTARADAIKEATRAIAIEPDYALGHALLALALADAYLVSLGDPAEVQRIRTIAERALALEPDDVSVLGPVGLALCWVGFPEEGERYTGRAVREAPISGMMHFYHGAACVMVNRPEEALSHLKTAERLMPGWHLMWLVKTLKCGAYRDLARWVEADAAIDESIRLHSTHMFSHVTKAFISLRLGRDIEARRHIATARKLGAEPEQTERGWRLAAPNSSTLEADIDIIRTLFAATEPSA